MQAASTSAGDCGDEDQVGRAGSILAHPPERSATRELLTTREAKLEEEHMDVVVTGRHCEVSDRFRSHVSEKLAKLEKLDHRIIRVQVEVENERNPRQSGRAVRVELTAFSKGPVIRAEAAADDKMGALDLALDKMAAQMRRAHDRRLGHRARGTKAETAAELAALAEQAAQVDESRPAETEAVERKVGPITVTGEGPLVVREKTFPAARMTLDQALYEMELVGHDFYLFVDKESERPSVVYRRRGYDYGVISLDMECG
jgi:ribosomal subunit interface protein